MDWTRLGGALCTAATAYCLDLPGSGRSDPPPGGRYAPEAEADLVAQVITVQNETLAEFCAAHSDRFVGLATVALQHPDLAAGQLEEGVKKFADPQKALLSLIGQKRVALASAS